MRRSAAAVAGLAILAVTWACSDQSGSQPRFPLEPSLAKGGPGGVCSQQAANDIEKDIKALYGNPAATANGLFDAVQAACSSDPASAREALMLYLDHTIANPVAGQESLMLGHWIRLFAFVGYSGNSAVTASNTSEDVFGASGATAVVDLSVGGVVLTRDDFAGISIPNQQGGVPGKVLVTIEPGGADCLTIGLQQAQGCQSFDIFPHVAQFTVPVVFGICADIALPANAALAHEPQGAAAEVLDPIVPGFCPQGHEGDEETATFFGRDLGRFGRVLASVANLFRPKELIAGHTGLGGSAFSASPVGPVDVQTFFADFNNDVIGQAPSVTNYPGGAWTSNAPSPGFVQVQSSLGNLTDQPVVLNQAGGACKNCGVLELHANMFNSGLAAANEGTYEIRFDAVQDGSSVKEAPFLARDGNERVFAKLAYRTVSSQRTWWFNGQDTGCAWTTDVAQHVVITIDFDTDQTSVAIDGCTSFGPVDFHQQNAASLVNIGWVMTGIDAGIVGWDNVQVVRLADNVP